MPNLVAFANEGKPIGSKFSIPRTIPPYGHWKLNKSPEGNNCILKFFYNFFNTFISECNKLMNENIYVKK